MDGEDPPESTSDNKQAFPARRGGRSPYPLPDIYQAIGATALPTQADHQRAINSLLIDD